MFPQKSQIIAEVDPKTYPLGEKIDHSLDGPTMALVALSHTPVEHRLYAAMLAALNQRTMQPEPLQEVFTVRALMALTGIISLSTIRRGLEGL